MTKKKEPKSENLQDIQDEMNKKVEEAKDKENPHLKPEDKEAIEKVVEAHKDAETLKEKMDHQHAPEPDVEREKLEEELKKAIEEEKAVEKDIKELVETGVPASEREDKSEEEKQAEKFVEEAKDAPEKGEEPLPEGVGAVEETTDDRGPSIREEQALAAAEAKKFDICPFCGTHAMEGAIQPKIPLPIGDQAILIALPMLICIRCTNAYMPRSFVQQLLTPETEKPKIITP